MILLHHAQELVYQLDHAGAWDRLARALATLPIFMMLYEGESRFEVLAHWKRVAEHGYDPEEFYRAALSELRVGNRSVSASILYRVATMLRLINRWSVAEELFRELVLQARDTHETVWAMRGQQGLGGIGMDRGEFAWAIDHLREAQNLAYEIGDFRGVAAAVGSIGTVYLELGKSAEAMESYQRQHTLCEELGDRTGMARAVTHVGIVHRQQGRYVEAMECNAVSLTYFKETGDRIGEALVISNMGIVHRHLEQYQEALLCFGRSLAISEEIGNRVGCAYTIGNMGNVHLAQQGYLEAIECYEQWFTTCEELGDRRGMALAVGNLGFVSERQGRYAEAQEAYDRQRVTFEESGNRRGVALAIGRMVFIHYELGQYVDALECLSRQLAITEEIGDRSEVASVIGNMGIIHTRLGAYQRALRCYQQAVDECRANGNRHELSQWLQGESSALLGILAERVMPEYLPEHVPNATEQSWRTGTLQRARQDADECLLICEELQQLDRLFGTQVLLARLAAADSDAGGAVQRLVEMSSDAADNQQRMQLHYWLWKLGATVDREAHGAEALRLYRLLVETTPSYEYRMRIEELERAEVGS